ncbi:MAG: metallophosphoesterase [Methylococcaceae bacterium]
MQPTSQQSNTGQPTSNNQNERIILHLSDLHYGHSLEKNKDFSEEKWSALKQAALKLKPDLVIITGDLVHSPFSKDIKKIISLLDEFATELKNRKDKTVEFCVIPGNHDTRFSGILPISWITCFFSIISLSTLIFIFLFNDWFINQFNLNTLAFWSLLTVITILLGFLGNLKPKWFISVSLTILCLYVVVLASFLVGFPSFIQGLFNWQSLIFGLSFIFICLSLTLRLALTANFAKAFDKAPSLKYLSKATPFDELGIGIAPFDSASTAKLWAEGHVDGGCFTARQADLQEHSNSNLVWIAAVHHHPLPLPYDSEKERMMIMDNAGSFLYELADMGIKLVLHGHKHHQNFARLIVDPAKESSLDIAVLSAGTPTEGNNPGTYPHEFNVIRKDQNGFLTFKMYECKPNEGSKFKPTSNSWLEIIPFEVFASQRFEKLKKKNGLWCRRMICNVDINVFGDAILRREFYGVATDLEKVTGIPGFECFVSKGWIEAYYAYRKSVHGPNVYIESKPHQDSLKSNYLLGELKFSDDGLQKTHDPIDFVSQFQGNNAFALNRWQLKYMYPDEPNKISEYALFQVNENIAVEEIILSIAFPQELPLPMGLELSQSQDDLIWRTFSQQEIIKIEANNSIQVRIPYPMSKATYKIAWEAYNFNNDREHSGDRDAAAIRNWLGKLNSDSKVKFKNQIESVLSPLSEIISNSLIEGGTMGNSHKLDLVLYVFDKSTKKLRCLVDTYNLEDIRKTWEFSYGMGLPGRAFKASTIAVFKKPTDYRPQEYPLGYLRGDEIIVNSEEDILESIILAFPLVPLNAPDWPYAVLQMSTDNPILKVKTKDTPTDHSVRDVWTALNGTMTIGIQSIMSQTFL